MPHRCAFGCKDTGNVMHQFPNPDKFPERFKAWVNLVGNNLETLTDYDIYKKKRICDIHFTDEHRNRFKRLNAVAMPTLYLPGKSHGITATAGQSEANLSFSHPTTSISLPTISTPGENYGITAKTQQFEVISTTEASGEGPSQIRKKIRSTKTQEELANAKKLLTEDNPNIAADQDNTFGLYLNQQLQKLSSDQRTFAEKLMSDVLFMARTNQLNATSVIVATRPSSQATTKITERHISQNSPFSSSPIQYVTSPYIQDKHSPPNTYTSSPIIIIKRPTSQNSAHSSTHFPKPTSKDGIETQVYDHTPSSQKVLSANSLVQNQDTLQDLPSTQLSSIPKILDGETKNSAPVQTEQVNTKILKQLLIIKKE